MFELSKEDLSARRTPACRDGSCPSSRHDARGATTVEFAMSAGILFLFLIVGFEILRMGLTSLTIQYVANKAARYAMIGLHSTITASNPPTSANRAQEVVTEAYRLGDLFGVNLRNDDVAVCPASAATCAPNSRNAADPDNFVRVTIRRRFNFVVAGAYYTLTANAIAKNENFRSQ